MGNVNPILKIHPSIDIKNIVLSDKRKALLRVLKDKRPLLQYEEADGWSPEKNFDLVIRPKISMSSIDQD